VVVLHRLYGHDEVDLGAYNIFFEDYNLVRGDDAVERCLGQAVLDLALVDEL